MQEDSFEAYSHEAPPPLHHQQASSFGSRSTSPPVYRSFFGEPWDGAAGSSGTFSADEYEEPAVYRSMPMPDSLFCDAHATLVYGETVDRDLYPVDCAPQCQPQWPPAPETPPFEIMSELEPISELFSIVLSFLPAHPDLFNAMAVSREWRNRALEVYHDRRTVHVPPFPDALERAVAAATPGDTLLLDDGEHWLSAELLIEKPLRLVGTNHLGAVLVSRCPSLLRTRVAVGLRGLTFCRMGSAEGNPNAVIVAESAVLTAEHCRVTCGGPLPSVEEALRVFDGAPPPGGEWQAPPYADTHPSLAGPTRQGTGPQSGVWVGACASVRLRHNTIACCRGPGVKIYRGKLLAEHNTIAFSWCGANVVVNSGRIVLTQNAIHGARGDGISSWNNSHIEIDGNTIHSNTGTGITINTGGGSVAIVRNSFFGNTLTAVQFATSNVKRLTIGEGELANDWTRNEAGGLHGLSLQSSMTDATARCAVLGLEGRRDLGAGRSSMGGGEAMEIDELEALRVVRDSDRGSSSGGSTRSGKSMASMELG